MCWNAYSCTYQTYYQTSFLTIFQKTNMLYSQYFMDDSRFKYIYSKVQSKKFHPGKASDSPHGTKVNVH